MTPGLAAAPPTTLDSEIPEGQEVQEDALRDPIWAALGYDPVSLDTLLARTGLDTPRLQVRLMELELEGRVARLPGGLFQRQAAV